MLPLLVELAILGEFKAFLTRMFPNISYSDLPDLVELSRIQDAISSETDARSTDAKNQLDQAKSDAARKLPGAEGRVANLQRAYDRAHDAHSNVSDEIRLVGVDILAALKLKPVDGKPDLSYTDLFDVDFTSVDFGASDLTGADIDYSDFSNADLSKVERFEGSHWNRTQWWRAKAISPALVDYLSTHAAFDAAGDYRGPSSSQKDYDTRVKALRP